jgi:hypothetical protein
MDRRIDITGTGGIAYMTYPGKAVATEFLI